MTPINSFRDLTVWQVSMDLAEICFDIVEAIPHPYRFTFADQLLPAVVLIEPIGKMRHGLTESLEARLNAQNA